MEKEKEIQTDKKKIQTTSPLFQHLEFVYLLLIVE